MMKLFLFRKVKFVLKVLCEWNWGKGLLVKHGKPCIILPFCFKTGLVWFENVKAMTQNPAVTLGRARPCVVAGNSASIAPDLSIVCQSKHFRFRSLMIDSNLKTCFKTKAVQRHWLLIKIIKIVQKWSQKPQNWRYIPFLFICPCYYIFSSWHAYPSLWTYMYFNIPYTGLWLKLNPNKLLVMQNEKYQSFEDWDKKC